MILVYRYRVKSLNGLLNKQSRAVNYVWNFCNDTQKHALKWSKKWPTGFDLNVLTTGSSKELDIHSGTINATCEQYAKSRSQHRRPYLRYRGRKSLGWVPLKGRDLKREGDAFRFAGNTFRVFNSRPLPEGKIKDGTNFAQDARGNWFLNIVIEMPDVQARPIRSGVGIDLGLKDFATLSTGEKLPNDRFGRRAAEKLAKAQRARKHKRHIAKLHAKIANARADFQHKLALDLVRRFDYIAVGNVAAATLARTRMAKSVYDASWSSFRNKLRYKAIAHGATFEEVDERSSTQSCSACGSKDSTTRPKGIAGLRVREWACSDCGVEHDRDINAALNILRCGRASPGVGILSLWGEEDVKVMSCASGSAGPPPRAVRAPPAIETSCRGRQSWQSERLS
ncbi:MULTISPECIES: RNA-guided endonuclease TnpB family protein [Burkholderia cepacia complex]|nr:transposase [Burkholderia cenocepacia]